jgi:hypothetical protein
MVLAEEVYDKTWESFVSEGMNAREERDGCQWKLGDLTAAITTQYGEDTIGKYAYAIGMERKTLMNYRTVSTRYSPDIRSKYRKLSFSHFAALMGTTSPEAWLEKADDNDWSVEKVRKELKEVYADPRDMQPDEDTPEVYRCPECGMWRLKDVSSMEICHGHYTMVKGEMEYH